jgi:hypothetical protein
METFLHLATHATGTISIQLSHALSCSTETSILRPQPRHATPILTSPEAQQGSDPQGKGPNETRVGSCVCVRARTCGLSARKQAEAGTSRPPTSGTSISSHPPSAAEGESARASTTRMTAASSLGFSAAPRHSRPTCPRAPLQACISTSSRPAVQKQLALGSCACCRRSGRGATGRWRRAVGVFMGCSKKGEG